MKRFFCFSLIELLTVVVIGSILMAIAVPSFSRMMRGSASTQAGRELMGRIQSARAYAVAQQTPVALVFYSREVPSGVSTLPQDYLYSAYRICKVKYDPGMNLWVFQDWASEWYFLPKGICVGLPREMTATLPSLFADRDADEDEIADGLIPAYDDNDSNDHYSAPVESTENSAEHNYFRTSNLNGTGVSPIYLCDVSDIFPGNNNPVTFRNAIVFNSNGMMEKPKNRTRRDTAVVLTQEVPVVIPMREAIVDASGVAFEGAPKEYIPLRIDPSGKTCFYDGYCEFGL